MPTGKSSVISGWGKSLTVGVMLNIWAGWILASTDMPRHGFPESDSVGAKLLYQKCNACHGVPKPDVHTADNWPAVIYRMQLRMQTKGQTPLSKEEMSMLIDYLQRHAMNK